jgi:bloom syndrome protein
MCLTATATVDTYQVICQRLSLDNPVLIGSPANRDNIYYEVKFLPDVEEFCATLAGDIYRQGLEYPKTIIFFRQYTDCALMYHVLQGKLGKYITFPPGYPVLQEFRVIDMYTRASTVEMKEKVLKSFCDTKGKLRVVLATTAFGMGVDCSDVRMIFHWGPPSTLEEYSQETGRAGRDNKPSKAVLLYGKGGRHIDKDMKTYAENKTSCRRHMMFKNFLFYEHNQENDHCCDICNSQEIII